MSASVGRTRRRLWRATLALEVGSLMTGSLGTGCSSSGWEVMDHAQVTAGPTLEQGRLFLAGSTYGVTRTLRSYDARSGLEHWQVEVGGWEDCTELAVRDGQVLLGCGAGVYGFDAITGQRRWRLVLPGPLVIPPALSQETGVVASMLPSGELELRVVNARTGVPVLERLLPIGSLVYPADKWILIGIDRTLSGLDAATGEQRWSLELSAPPSLMMKSASGVFAVAGDALLGIDPDAGRLKWTRVTEGQVNPATLDGLICYAQGGLLFGVEAETGEEKWRTSISGAVSSPLLTHDVVYIHTAGGVLHALSSVDGEPLWKLTAGPPGRRAALNDEYYAWVTDRQVRVVDLVRRTVKPSILLKGVPVTQEEAGKDPVRTPLLLHGPHLFGVERERRMFMIPLEE